MYKFEKNDELELLGSYLRDAATSTTAVAQQKLSKVAKALELPLRQAILDGDIYSDIFEPMDKRGRDCVRLPLDFMAPGMENDFTAFAIPECTCMPECPISHDYLVIPHYRIGNCIDWCFDLVENADYNIMGRIQEVLMQGMVKKKNDDGWHTIMAAAADRGIIVHNSAAPAGYFSKGLLSAAQVAFRRNGGGNSSSSNRFRLTDVYMSPEAMASIRSWNFSEIDDVTRNRILNGDCDQGLMQLYCVNLHQLDEFGVGQEYQNFWSNELSQPLPGGTQEIAIGLDRSKNNSFVMPIVKPLNVVEDINVRCERMGLIARESLGFATLDGRNTIALGI